VRSPYGGLFERKVILTWLQRNGSVCPLTGQPLGESELTAAPDVVEEVRKFFEKPTQPQGEQEQEQEEQQQQGGNVRNAGPSPEHGTRARPVARPSEVKEQEDDPYDF
jgi:hypothetical protein